MTKHYTLFWLCLFLLLGVQMQAQKFNLSIGMNLGGSNLNHQTRFESTTLRNLYETIAITHPDGYEWEQFEEDFELRENFNQLRFGFFVRASHSNIPLLIIGEAMSSTSTYEKMAYGVTGGLGKEFYLFNDGLQVSFLGGYKFLWDKGFGSSTLVNSIGHKDARKLVATYFDPSQPLGTTFGNLFVLRGGIGKVLDRERQWAVGAEAFGELDLTDRIKREARMTNVGVNIFLRYNLQKKKEYPPVNNNPYYYR